MQKTTRGFTIVELLIVIVVIAILAAISIVAYNGIQTRARDAQRKSDIAQIKKALLAYNTIHGGVIRAPIYTDYGTGPSYGGWDHSAGANWLTFLRAEHGSMPVDPLNTVSNANNAPDPNNRLYSYFCYNANETNSIGYPNSAGVTLNYYSEPQDVMISNKFIVDSCLTTIP